MLFQISPSILPCCCINDWTVGNTKKNGESETCCLFSTNLAALNKVTIAEGSMDTCSTGANQRKFAFVVPADMKERILRGGRA